MATLVDKIKDKVRSRSSSRSSTSSPIGQSASRNSTDIPDVPKIPDRNAPYSSLSSPPTRQDGFPRTSLENSAFHVSRGVGSRASVDSPIARKPLPNASGPSIAQHRKKYSVGGQQSGFEDAIPPRGSSRHGLEEEQARGHNRGASMEEQQAAVEDIIPERASSKQADTTPSRTVWAVSNQQDADSPPRTHSRRISIPERLAHKPPADSELSKPLPEIPAAHKNKTAPLREAGHSATPTNDPVSSSAWMSPLISTGPEQTAPQASSQDNDAAKYEAMARGHLRLPEKFNLQNTEETHVYETQRPAVTHETIIKERTEIIHEEITRDIHIHHYYTYQQPIKLVEILPPKHFFLNLQTGEKTEIEPPFGWTMPASMFPVSPETSHLAGWTRHYLVNDEHPYGIPEEIPAQEHESTSDNLRADPTTQQRV